MFTASSNDNAVIIIFNLLGIVVSYVMLGISLYLSTEVPLATKGFWAISVLMLTISLVNFVKYRFDNQLAEDRVSKLEMAKNEKYLSDYVGKD
ncbi:MAG: hypothetical protein ACU0DW_01925 [Shimia sp.]